LAGGRFPRADTACGSVPTPRGATLIVNRKTGQWGTEYDAGQDVARLELTRESLAEPVDQFTIAMEPADGGAVLRLSWDVTSYLVPFTIASPR
jgi:hypothetical protein